MPALRRPHHQTSRVMMRPALADDDEAGEFDFLLSELNFLLVKADLC